MPASASASAPCVHLEDALFDACTAAHALTGPLAAWHAAGRPPLFNATEPELTAAMAAMADLLLTNGPLPAARALGEVMPAGVWLLLDDPEAA